MSCPAVPGVGAACADRPGPASRRSVCGEHAGIATCDGVPCLTGGCSARVGRSPPVRAHRQGAGIRNKGSMQSTERYLGGLADGAVRSLNPPIAWEKVLECNGFILPRSSRRGSGLRHSFLPFARRCSVAYRWGGREHSARGRMDGMMGGSSPSTPSVQSSFPDMFPRTAAPHTVSATSA